MELNVPQIPLKLPALILAAVAFLAGIGLVFFQLFGQARKEYYTIAIFYDSNTLAPEDKKVVELIIDKKVAEVNKEGGISGRDLRIKYLDDKGDTDSTLKVVQESITDKTLIAYLGCWGSTKAAAVAKLIAEHKIPYIGGYSITSIARPYPNMFTYEIGIDQFAFAAYNLVKAKSKRPAFIGNSGDFFTGTLHHKVTIFNEKGAGIKFGMQKWYSGNHQFTEEELKYLVSSLKGQADFLVLSVKSTQSNILLRKLWQEGVYIPVFLAYNDIPEIDTSIPGYKQAELYDISVFGIPSALKMRSQMLKDQHKAELKYSVKVDFLIGVGALIADAVGLVQTTAHTNLREKNIRERITKGLQSYINGGKLYRGWSTDWYFTEKRALATEAVLGWKPPNFPLPILAPYQFLHSDSGITKTQVLYTNIDLIRIDRISDEAGSFNAAFYLEINSKKNITISQINFANAARNEINHEPLLEIKMLRADSASGPDQLYNYLYLISGKFFFDRNLKHYPFDQQQFTITLQTNSAFQPFLIQPPGLTQRDTIFKSPGWNYVSNYVGYDQDIIYTAKNFLNKQTYLPNYKFIYTYVLKRAQVDFFLKVFTPLLAILIIAYFSVFIPFREFEAICGIQVTALLAAIALYFSTYKPEMQNATISDRIFIFTYIMITTLIGTSVLLYSLHHKKKDLDALGKISRFYQLFIFPAILIGLTIFSQWYH